MADTIKCPKCGFDINITDAMNKNVSEGVEKAKLAMQVEMQKQMAAQAKEIQLRAEAAAKEQAEKAAKEKAEGEMNVLRQKLAAEEKAKAEQASSAAAELAKLNASLEASKAAAEQAAKKEAEYNTKLARIEEENKAKVEAEAANYKRSIDAEFKLREAELLKKNEQLSGKIEELSRDTRIGSQQLQGEVLEQLFEGILKEMFPDDLVENVKIGEYGADVIHTVRNTNREPLGLVIWELKRTKAFETKWIEKLKEEVLAKKADFGVIVSESLPKNYDAFQLRDGFIWVSDVTSAKGLAILIREMLVRLNVAKKSNSNSSGKMQLLYEFFASTEFMNLANKAVGVFRNMEKDLEDEIAYLNKKVKSRQKHIAEVKNTVFTMIESIKQITAGEITIEGAEKPLIGE